MDEPLTQAQERALRQVILPLVQDMVTALEDAGMPRLKACKTVRWATYRLQAQEQK